jgi:hypothetical protein
MRRITPFAFALAVAMILAAAFLYLGEIVYDIAMNQA